MPCSNCSQTGHNIRTCTYLEPVLISDDLSSISYDEFDTHDLDPNDVRMGMADLIADTPSLIYPHCTPDYAPPLECMVCYEVIEDEKVNLKCGHAYCVQCFIKHMRVGNNCAGCRAPICEPPKKQGSNRAISHSEVSDIIEHQLNSGPDFLESIHSDLLRQTKKYIEENYEDTTERQRCQMSIMVKRAIESTDLTFGFWIAGVSMAQSIIDAVVDDYD